MSLVCVIQQQTGLGESVVSPVGTRSRQFVWFCSALARLQLNYFQNTDILSLSVPSDTCTVTPLLLLHSLFFFTMAAGETCCTHPDIILTSSSHAHVYDALICHCTAEPCSHALQLHLLRVTGAPAGGVSPSGRLVYVGLSHA